MHYYHLPILRTLLLHLTLNKLYWTEIKMYLITTAMYDQETTSARRTNVLVQRHTCLCHCFYPRDFSLVHVITSRVCIGVIRHVTSSKSGSSAQVTHGFLWLYSRPRHNVTFVQTSYEMWRHQNPVPVRRSLADFFNFPAA